MVPFDITIENLSRKAAVDVQLTVPPGAGFVDTSGLVQVADDSWVWQRDFQEPTNENKTFHTVLPDNTYGAILIDVDIDAGINRSLMTDSSEHSVDLGELPFTSPSEEAFARLTVWEESVRQNQPWWWRHKLNNDGRSGDHHKWYSRGDKDDRRSKEWRGDRDDDDEHDGKDDDNGEHDWHQDWRCEKRDGGHELSKDKSSTLNVIRKKLEYARYQAQRGRSDKAITALLLVAEKASHIHEEEAAAFRLAVDGWLYQLQREL